MLRLTITIAALCFLVACASAPPAEEPSAGAGAGTIIRLDPALDAIVPANAKVEKLDEGFQFLEGPLWVNRDGGYLLFSDVPGNKIYKWVPGAKSTVFAEVAGPNGLTLDREGRLVACEHGGRRIFRMPLAGGEPETVVDNFEGKKLSSPNDLVYHSDGALYFTDPPYGLEGMDESPDKEIETNSVFRLAPDGTMTLVVPDLERPNGIALSPDEKILYVADAGKKLWMAYDVQEDGSVDNARVFFDASSNAADGGADGMKLDADGNLYATGPGGVHIFTPDGKHLGTIQVDEVPANVAWGGPDGQTLYMTARTGLYSIHLNARGVQPAVD